MCSSSPSLTTYRLPMSSSQTFRPTSRSKVWEISLLVWVPLAQLVSPLLSAFRPLMATKVKIMWPRGENAPGPGADMTAARRNRNSGLSGFVSFMRRKDAEAALKEFGWIRLQGEGLSFKRRMEQSRSNCRQADVWSVDPAVLFVIY